MCCAFLLSLPSCTVLFGPGPDEIRTTLSFSPDVRIVINSPSHPDPVKRPLLILFALPNGNTIEMTAGKIMHEGDDWHYNIQHIAAQTRFVRAHMPDRTIHIAYLETAQRSWPAWRKMMEYRDSLVGAIVSVVRKECGDPEEVMIAGHSGGGSFLNGFINAYDTIPSYIRRIAYLDANYSYADSLDHGGKLLRWLRADSSHHLCVIAYDDREITFNGKKVVGPDGGTYRATQRMIRRFTPETEIAFRQDSVLQQFTAFGKRARFTIHTNPDTLILHTVLVERNGFIHAVLMDTPQEEKDFRFFGDRVYNSMIREEP